MPLRSCAAVASPSRRRSDNLACAEGIGSLCSVFLLIGRLVMEIVHCATRQCGPLGRLRHAQRRRLVLPAVRVEGDQRALLRSRDVLSRSGRRQRGFAASSRSCCCSSRIFGKILCSMPFVNLGGPCAPIAGSDGRTGRGVSVILERTQAKFLEVRSRRRIDNNIAVSEHKVSMTVELCADSEAIWKAFTSKHRNNIRRAYGHGFTTVTGGAELLDPCYDVLLESWRNLGRRSMQSRTSSRSSRHSGRRSRSSSCSITASRWAPPSTDTIGQRWKACGQAPALRSEDPTATTCSTGR